MHADQLEAESGEFRKSLVNLYPTLLAYARRITRDRADAEDLVHDAMERGLRRRDLFRSGVPGGWMATIVRHLFLDRCRHARRWKAVGPAWQRFRMQEGPPTWYDGGVDSTRAPARPSDRYGVEDVERAIPLLKPALRQVFCMYELQHLPQREIGRQLCLPVSTVGTRLLRARRKLRKLLEGTGRRRGRPRPRRRTDSESGAALAA